MVQVELSGAAYLDGVLVNYDGVLTEQQIKDIVNSKKFSWTQGTELTFEIDDANAYSNGDCDFMLIIDGQYMKDFVLPKDIKQALTYIDFLRL